MIKFLSYLFLFLIIFDLLAYVIKKFIENKHNEKN